MKKIILSALLASTVAVTAFAGPGPGTADRQEIAGLFRDVAMMSGDFGVALRLDLSLGTQGNLVGAVSQIAPEATVTEIPAKGDVTANQVAAVKLAFPGKAGRASLVCASRLADVKAKKDKFTVFCGKNLQSVVTLLTAVSTNAGE